MKTLLVLLGLSISCYAVAIDDVNDDVNKLIENSFLVDASVFSEAWGLDLCDSERGIYLTKEQLPILEDHEYAQLIHEKILEVKHSKNDNKYNVTAGKKCIALNEYYFHNKKTEFKDLSTFYEMEGEFIKKYEFSVFDAIWVLHNLSVSNNGILDQYTTHKIETMKRKGLIDVYQRKSSFNGKPSTATFYCLSEVGSRFRDKLLGITNFIKVSCNPKQEYQ